MKQKIISGTVFIFQWAVILWVFVSLWQSCRAPKLVAVSVVSVTPGGTVLELPDHRRVVAPGGLGREGDTFMIGATELQRLTR